MANYESKTVSNWFKVKDISEFKKFMRSFPGAWELEESQGEVSFAGYDCAPHWKEVDGCEVDINFAEELAPHLQEGEVCVMNTIGSEKLRCVNGQSWAVNHKGEEICMDFIDIGALTYKKWGVRPSSLP